MRIVKIIAFMAIGFLPFLLVDCTSTSVEEKDEVQVVSVEEAKSDSTKSDSVKVEGKCGEGKCGEGKCGEGKCE